MEILKITEKISFPIAALVTFAVGLLMANFAADRLIGVGMLLVILSAVFSVTGAIFIVKSDSTLKNKLTWLAVTVIPFLFVAYFVATAKD